ncbi:type IV pili methyl-accepting chemotaxis transducer N-terminal domain-containing protein [Xanthocytophaga agilis]|uniref:Type IV pili methyl-accepting chemotaxis transducer N-terminal domain-containing protein n=1 Tax=Xanthocytophaga agilis TaxID=3048010 RepID=A0AAE3UDD9_9BACT|nr:type IV pili methyl-accepting chemotaxis transducer N-terminal domain-containing protein [Xanthocytophaga agilis]MDJ1501733.1 type IV pili methyl-accepting chemotaxis transducer N-terminal domain-containing protein [Xanthocytophaga agilis]
MGLPLVSFKDYSIRLKLGIVLIFFVIIALFNLFSVSYYLKKQKSDATAIDVVGRQRMLTVRIAFLSEILQKQYKENIATELQKTIEQANTSFYAIKHGGLAPEVNSEIPLPPAPAIITPLLLEVEDLWKKYKEHASHILETHNETSETSLTFIEANAGELVRKYIALVKIYVTQSQEKQESFEHFLVLLFTANLILVGCAFLVTEKYIRKPILTLQSDVERLSSGDLSHLVSLPGKDEVGLTAQNLHRLSDFMKTASLFAVKIGHGEFDSSFTMASDKDQLGQSLLTMRDQLHTVAEEEKKRKWANEGITQATEIIQTYRENFQQLGDKLLVFLTHYLEANQSALFVTQNESNEEEMYLTLASCFAWGRKKHHQKHIQIDEGLTGQVLREKCTYYLTEVPDDYIEIGSGLGHATPNCILIVPLKLDEMVLGVLEIAAFKEIEPYKVQFIEKLAESLALSISTFRTTARTLELLQQSQQQAEELKAQEEEIRQNMEELQATQEQALLLMKEEKEQRKYLDWEIKTYKDVLGTTGIWAELDPQGVITDCNQMLVETTKFTKEELVGKPYVYLWSKETIDQLGTSYQENLQAGEPFQAIIRNRTSDGKGYWAESSLSPIRNNQGDILKYILIEVPSIHNSIQRISLSSIQTTNPYSF